MSESERTVGAPGHDHALDAEHPRTGAETPVDPEDLAMAEGEDPTLENVEKHRRRLEEKGAAAVEESTP